MPGERGRGGIEVSSYMMELATDVAQEMVQNQEFNEKEIFGGFVVVPAEMRRNDSFPVGSFKVEEKEFYICQKR